MAKTSTKLKVTKASVERAEPYRRDDGSFGQRLYFDTALRGFGFVVSPGGTKSFFAQYGGTRKTIGRFGPYAVEQARVAARDLLARMARGEDVRRNNVQAITLGEALDQYLEVLEAEGRSPRTIDGYRDRMSLYLVGWKNRPLAEISRKDVYDRHRKLAAEIREGKYGKGRKRRGVDGGPTANATFRTFRAVFNHAAKVDETLPRNPSIAIRWFPQKRRRTAIRSTDLADWCRQIMGLENPIRRDYLLFALFTGLRRTNASEVQWRNVDLEAATLHVPRPKSRVPFDLPVSDFLVELLQRRRTENEIVFPGSPWAFPADSRSGHIAEPRIKSMHFQIHDLRRTFISVAESLDVSPYAIKLLVNHALPSGDVTAGYVRHETDRLRAPMQAITDRLRELCSPDG
jgi:integrase